MLIIIFVCFLGTYIPRKEVEVIETIRATIIKPNEAIKLRARGETKVSYLTLSLKLDGFLSVYIHYTHTTPCKFERIYILVVRSMFQLSDLC